VSDPESIPSGHSYFNPKISVNSGQMFLWQQIGHSWYGTYGDHIIKFTLSNEGRTSKNKDKRFEFCSYPEFKGWESKVFRFDDNISKVLSNLSNDALVYEAIKKYHGLRLMRQEPHQCFFSFACASNTNIIMIRRMLKNLSKKFGTKLTFDGNVFYTFPTIKSLNKATVNDLHSCGVGYRAKTIKSVAEHLISGNLDINRLVRSEYDEAKDELLKVYGIGNKIADCILLFALEKLDSFPIDVWILKAISRYYYWLLEEHENAILAKLSMNESISASQYRVISQYLRSYFGKYSGYAQQFIYYHMREAAGKRW
jgi:N-glycosylase/DNA lyase